MGQGASAGTCFECWTALANAPTPRPSTRRAVGLQRRHARRMRHSGTLDRLAAQEAARRGAVPQSPTVSQRRQRLLLHQMQMQCLPEADEPPCAEGAFFDEPSVEMRGYCWEGKLRVAAKVSPPSRSFESEYLLTDIVVGSGMSGTVCLARPQRRVSFVDTESTASSPSSPLRPRPGDVAQTRTASGSSDPSSVASGAAQLSYVAVKTLDKKGLTESSLQKLLMEVDIYLKMDHANIAKLLRVFNEEDKVYLVMEYCSGGSLCDRLLSSGPFSEKDAAAAVRQVLSAVNYCHRHPEGKVCHRDLKHSNFIYSSNDEGAPLKLVDFGLSRVLQPHRKTISSYAGTLYYMAPEVVLRQSYNESCDMWSVGVIAYSLLCGDPPFRGTTQQGVAEAIARADLTMDSEVWSGVGELAKDFVKQLLQVDPSRRPSAEQALQHPWFQSSTQDRRPGCTGFPQPRVPLSATVLERVRRFAHESALRRATAACVVYSCVATCSAVRQVEAQFQALDVDGNGTVSVTELVKALKQVLGVSEKEASWIFSQLDLDGDKELHLCEFLAAAMGSHLLRCADTVREAFSMFDLDRDGKIELFELQKVLGPLFCGTPTKDIFAELDTNGDNSVDLDEFSVGVARTRSPRRMPMGTQSQPETEPPPDAEPAGRASPTDAGVRAPSDGADAGGDPPSCSEPTTPQRHVDRARSWTGLRRDAAAASDPPNGWRHCWRCQGTDMYLDALRCALASSQELQPPHRHTSGCVDGDGEGTSADAASPPHFKSLSWGDRCAEPGSSLPPFHREGMPGHKELADELRRWATTFARRAQQHSESQQQARQPCCSGCT